MSWAYNAVLPVGSDKQQRRDRHSFSDKPEDRGQYRWNNASRLPGTVQNRPVEWIFGHPNEGGNGLDDFGSIDRRPVVGRHAGIDQINQQLHRYLSAQALNEREGRRPSPFIEHRIQQLQRMGGTAQPDDYNSENFDVTTARHLRGINAQDKGRAMSPAVWNADLETIRAQNAQQADQKFFDEQVNPSQELAQHTLSDLTTTPTFDAQRLADMRSQLAAGIKGSEQNRLATVGSIFGASGGIGSGSPAAAALAESVAAQSDARLAASLNQMGIDTSQANRDNASSAAGLLSSLSIARQQARQAATAGDRQRLYQISDNLAATLEAIKASKELRQQQNQAMDQASSDANKANYVKLGATALGTFFGGPIGGAAAGTAAGAAMGSGGGSAVHQGNESMMQTSGAESLYGDSPGGNRGFDYGSIYND